MNISFEVDAGEPIALLGRAQANISNTGLWGWSRQVAEPRFAAQAAKRFSKGGDAASGRWAPLSPATVDIRTSLGYVPIRTNVRTGMLRNWLIDPQSVLGADGLGTTMLYPGRATPMLRHRLAQAAGKRRGPARWVVAFGAGDVAYLCRTLAAWSMAGEAR